MEIFMHTSEEQNLHLKMLKNWVASKKSSDCMKSTKSLSLSSKFRSQYRKRWTEYGDTWYNGFFFISNFALYHNETGRMLCTGDVEYLKRKSIKYLPYVCVLINNLSHQHSAIGITKK